MLLWIGVGAAVILILLGLVYKRSQGKVIITLGPSTNDSPDHVTIGDVQYASNYIRLTDAQGIGKKGVIGWQLNPGSKWKATFSFRFTPSVKTTLDDGILFRVFGVENTTAPDWAFKDGTVFYYSFSDSSVSIRVGGKTKKTKTSSVIDGNWHDVELKYDSKRLTCKIDNVLLLDQSGPENDESGPWVSVGSWNHNDSTTGSANHDVKNIVVTQY